VSAVGAASSGSIGHKKTGRSRFFCGEPDLDRKPALMPVTLACGRAGSGSGSQCLDVAIQAALMASGLVLVQQTFVGHAVKNRNSDSVSLLGSGVVASFEWLWLLSSAQCAPWSAGWRCACETSRSDERAFWTVGYWPPWSSCIRLMLKIRLSGHARGNSRNQGRDIMRIWPGKSSPSSVSEAFTSARLARFWDLGYAGGRLRSRRPVWRCWFLEGCPSVSRLILAPDDGRTAAE